MLPDLHKSKLYKINYLGFGRVLVFLSSCSYYFGFCSKDFSSWCLGKAVLFYCGTPGHRLYTQCKYFVFTNPGSVMYFNGNLFRKSFIV